MNVFQIQSLGLMSCAQKGWHVFQSVHIPLAALERFPDNADTFLSPLFPCALFAQLLMKSELPFDVLGQIWSVADYDQVF